MKIFSDGLPVICALVASLSLFSAFKGFKEFDFVKMAWMLIFIGITADLIAETIYGVLEVGFKMNMDETYPSIADYFWCGAYIFFLTGLAMMFFGYKNSGFPMGKIIMYILIIIVCLGLFCLVLFLLLIPYLKDASSTPLAKFISLFYPIGDMLCVIPAIILMYITSLLGKGALSRPWRFLAIGFICFTLADMIYLYLVNAKLYGNGNFVDLAWHSGYLLIALSGIYQKELLE